MTTHKHTPGPWSAGEARKHEWFVSSEGEGIDLARMLHNGKPHPKGTRGMNQAMAANAHLIAAAPELLEALQNARNVIGLAVVNGAWDGEESSDECDSPEEVQSVIAGIDAALDKAVPRD